MIARFRFVVVLALLASMFAAVFPAIGQAFSYKPIDPVFQATWDHSDRPVAELQTRRTWSWGPGGYTESFMEEYVDAPGQERLVQYFDKSRMEVTNPDGDTANAWTVTQGLLVRELITGYLQLGDDWFEQHPPAQIPVAGDPNDTRGPTYAAFSHLTAFDPLPTGWVLIQTMDREGNIDADGRYAEYGVTAGYYVEATNHNVASVFWDLMTSTTLVYADGQYLDAGLFPNPFYAVGFPLTEAYWAEVKVGGVVQPVLMQCFERRCLTYTPENPEGWQIEAGNVGQHYYAWRYQTIDRDNPLAPAGPGLPDDSGVDGPEKPVVDPADGEVTADPTLITVDETSTITATVLDADGSQMAGVDVTFSIADEDSGAEAEADASTGVVDLPEQTTVTTNESGQASIDVIGLSVGTAVIEATAPTTNGSISLGTVDITVGAAQLVLSIDPETVSVGGSSSITATVTDIAGLPVTGVEVSFSVDGEDPVVSLSGASATTDETGVATVTATGDLEGTATITASVDIEDAQLSDSGTLTVTAVDSGGDGGDGGDDGEDPLEEHTLSLAISPAAVNVAGEAAITALVVDTDNNPVPGAEVTFDVIIGGTVVSLSETRATSGDNGEATVTATGIDSGTAIIRASALIEGQTLLDLNSLLVLPAGYSASLELTVEPDTIGIGDTATLTATLTGPFGMLLEGFEVEFAVTDGDGSVELPSTMVVQTNSLGQASIEVTGLTEGLVTIEASSVLDMLTVSDEVTLTVLPDPGQSGLNLIVDPERIGIDDTASLTAIVTDPAGNLADGVDVVFDVIGQDGIVLLSGLPATTNVDGEATATATGVAEGTVTIEASAVVDGVPVSDTVDLTVGSIVEVFVEPVSIETGDIATVTATVFDANGVGIEGVDVTFRVDDDTLVLMPATLTVTTDASGIASIDVEGASPGTATLTASAVVGVDTLTDDVDLLITEPVAITGIQTTASLLTVDPIAPW